MKVSAVCRVLAFTVIVSLLILVMGFGISAQAANSVWRVLGFLRRMVERLSKILSVDAMARSRARLNG